MLSEMNLQMKCLLRGTTKLARVLGPYLAKEDPNWGMKVSDMSVKYVERN